MKFYEAQYHRGDLNLVQEDWNGSVEGTSSNQALRLV